MNIYTLQLIYGLVLKIQALEERIGELEKVIVENYINEENQKKERGHEK